jgi:tRNA-uridine 2-sulfurtransferase
MKLKRKVVLGMSGGVDSSVAALLLQKDGYEVVGFFMNCNVSGMSKLPSSINWQNEERDVHQICRKLGIKLNVFDCEVGYGKKVIGKMVEDYAKGLTPNPDTLCNKIGKFPKMLKLAREIGAENIATGHYARVKDGNLYMGKDMGKDQSYFLCDLGKRELSRVLFPLGGMKKEEVREIARKSGFKNWDKRSSRGICYLGKIDVKKFLRSRIPEREGDVVYNGDVVGRHPGIYYFTIGERIGERKGIVLDKKFRRKFAGDKMYIARKENGNRLIVGKEDSDILKTRKVFVKGFRWMNKEIDKRNGLKARVRHLGELHGGVLKQEQNGVGSRKIGAHPTTLKRGERLVNRKLGSGRKRWVFEFSRGVEGVAAGQSIVFYKGERMVASGEIRV